MTAIVQRLRRPALTTDYRHDLRLFRTRASKLAVAAVTALWLVLPSQFSDF